MMKHASVHVAAVVWILTSAMASAQPAGGPSVIELIQAIHDAPDATTASKAYVEARSADKADPQIYKIYIQRMLELGQPLLAAVPAAELTAIEAQNGLAWGVIGYAKARSGRVGEAMPALINAAKYADDNAGIMFNAGVICAWQESTVRKSDIPSEAASSAASLKSQWESKKDFAEGGKAALAAFKLRQDYIKTQHERLTKLDSDIKDAQGKNREAAEQFNVLKRRSDALERRMRAADETVRRYNFDARNSSDTRLPAYVTEAQADYRQARDELAGVVRQGNALRQVVVLRERAIIKAQQQKERETKALQAFEKCDPTMPWKPPAVGGVIAADASDAVAEEPAASGPTATTGASPLSQGQRRLKLAQMLIRNNQRDKAIQELLAIIQQYPDSEISRQAQALLDTITL
ncbi:MAG: hypothetical protein ABFD92_09340 [Planctomycetaceae bacterium]|nr:hypothetical protein [Planctomycetaceae bacterium]